jgi:Bacterial Ig-like domain (group 3)/Invasin, domain 3
MRVRTRRLLFMLAASASVCTSLWAAGGSSAAPPAKHIALTLQPTSIIANGTSVTTATAKVTDAAGKPVSKDSVEFSSSDPGQTILAVSNKGNGTYAAVIRSSTTPGTVTIFATDTTAKISTQRQLVQTAAGSGLSLVAVPSTVVTNQTVTLVATVTTRQAGAITFTTGQGTPVAGCVARPVTAANPAAVCQMTFAASTSPETVEATFSPSPSSHVTGASAVAVVTVGRDSTTTSVEAVRTVQAGTPTTYVTTVSPPSVRPGPILPSGSVEFFDGGQPIGGCVSKTLTNGQATCTVTYQTPGTHSITAGYGGDSNFVGSGSSAAPVSVSSAPVNVLGIIDATMQWSFAFGPTYTNVLSLVVHGASPGESVLVSCNGRGCPFRKRTIAVTKTKRCGPKGKRKCPTHGNVNLTPVLSNHRLRVGTQLNVRIVRGGWVGRYYLFTVRPRHGPKIQIACLAPGRTRPGVGC